MLFGFTGLHSGSGPYRTKPGNEAATEPDLSTPEEALKSLFRALKTGNESVLARCCTPELFSKLRTEQPSDLFGCAAAADLSRRWQVAPIEPETPEGYIEFRIKIEYWHQDYQFPPGHPDYDESVSFFHAGPFWLVDGF